MLVSVEAALSLLDALSFLGCAERVPRTIVTGYMSVSAPAAPLWVSCDLVPWRLTFSEEVRVGSSGAPVPRPLPWKVTFLTTSG